MSETRYPIHVKQLVPGLFLDFTEDTESPFQGKRFKLKDAAEVAKVREAGLTQVICILDKSDRMPLSPEEAGLAPAKPRGGGGGGGSAARPGEKTPVSRELFGLRKETVEKNKERRKTFAKCEKRYDETMNQVSTILRRVSGRSTEALDDASALVDGLVGAFLSDRDTVINLMGSKSTEESKNYHALNVTVLSMMLAKDLNLKAEGLKILGMGTLFHDMGKGRIPLQAVSGRASSMNTAAEKYLKEHPVIGARMAQDMPGFPRQAMAIILQHHEEMSGRGYPSGLAGDKISPLARIVYITNRFDNLLNARADSRLTPHEAIKAIYAERAAMDSRFLSAFIKAMGVYPAGTVVELSNGQMGMVISVNPARAAKPTVLMYHPEVPKNEALMVDLTIEEELEVVKAVRPEDLTREVFNYLRPSTNINYTADTV